MIDTYIGTTNGVFRLRDDAPEALGLESERVSALTPTDPLRVG